MIPKQVVLTVFILLCLLASRDTHAWRARTLDKYQTLKLLGTHEAEALGNKADVKADRYASGGKCLVIGKSRQGLSLTFEAPEGVTAVWLYGRVPSATVDPPWPPLYLNVTITNPDGTTTKARQQVPSQPTYEVVACFYVLAPVSGTYTVNISGDAESEVDLQLDFIELRDQLTNCERKAYKQDMHLLRAKELEALRAAPPKSVGKGKKRPPKKTDVVAVKTPAQLAIYADSVWRRLPALNTLLGKAERSALNDLVKDATEQAEAYQRNGDAASARRAAVILAALAQRAPTFDLRFHDVNTISGRTSYNRFSQGAGHPYGATRLPRAYDQIFTHVRNDGELAKALGKKIPGINTPEDLRAFLDRGILQYEIELHFRFTYMCRLLGWENWIATDILALGPNKKGQAYMDKLMRLTYADLSGNGGLPDYMINAISRDGSNYDGSSNYTMGVPYNIVRNAILFERFVEQGGQVPAMLWDPTVNPRLLSSAFFTLNWRTAGGFQLIIGDGGSSHDRRFTPFDNRIDGQPALWAWRFKHGQDPVHAWMGVQVKRPPTLDAQLWKQMQEVAKDVPHPVLHARTRCLPAFGNISLELGEEDTDPALKAAAVLRFGTGVAHQHGDLLDLGYNAFNKRIIVDGGRAGFPWPRFTAQHNTVEVSRSSFQSTINSGAYGYPLGMCAAGRVRFASAGGRSSTHPELKDYRRDVALIDLGVHKDGDKSLRYSYVFSVNRVSGGNVHTWCTHGMRGDLTMNTELHATEKDPLGLMYKCKELRTGTATDPLISYFKAQSAPNRKTGKVTAYDYGLRNHLFGWGGKTIYTAKGTGFYNKDIPYIWIERVEKEPIDDCYPALFEPTWKEPAITSAKALKVEGGNKGSNASHAVEVKDRWGRKDVVIISNAAVPVTVEGGISTDAHMALVVQDKTGIVEATLIGGSYLRGPDLDLTLSVPCYQGTVSALDQKTGKIVLNPAIPAKRADGAFVIFGDPPHVAGEYLEVRNDGLYLKRTVEAFRSPIVSVDEERNAVIPEIAMQLTAAEPSFYDGCVATNEKHDKFWRVKRCEVTEMWMPLFSPITEAMITDADGDGKRTVKLTGFALPEQTRDPVIKYYGNHQKPVRWKQFNREPFKEPVVLEVLRIDAANRRLYFKPPADYDLVWNGWVYDGTTITNEANDRQWRSQYPAREFRIVLDGPVRNSDFTDALSPLEVKKDGRRRIHLYHFGVGSPYRLENAVSFVRSADGVYAISGDVPATATYKGRKYAVK